MTLQVRQMQPSDAEKLHRLYERFVLKFVGAAKRQPRRFQNVARRRDNLRWIALSEEAEIIGYIVATYLKGRRTGRIGEIIVDPECNFETVARVLVDKIHDVLLEKGAAQIQAFAMQDPSCSRIFPSLGFWHMRPDGVFMYAITNVEQFLGEIAPIIIKRLGRLTKWNGMLRIACENHHIQLKKDGETVQALSSANYPSDCDIIMNASCLIRVLLGAIEVQNALSEDLITVRTDLSAHETNKLLLTLFPRKEFLTFDYW